MTRRSCYLALALLFANAALAATYSNRTVNWNGYADNHEYTLANFNSDFGNSDSYNEYDCEVFDGSFKIKVPASTESSGLIAQAAVPARARYTVEAKVRFPSSFNWGTSNDMKMPIGLGGGTNPTGGNTDKNNGWTARVVIDGATRKFAVYTYDTTRATWGVKHLTNVVAQTATWYTVKLQVQRNTNGQANGTLKLWIDGSQKINKTAMDWSNNTVDVDTIMVHFFRGGAGDPPNVETYIWFDDLNWNDA